jgi:long-chain acyl-CoA synthetase
MPNPRLVHEFLTATAKRLPEKTALICGEERHSYASLDRASDQLALALLTMGSERHDRVVIYLDNSVEAVNSLYGILKAGGTFVIVNHMVKGKKLAHIVQDAGARIIIVHTDRAGEVEEASCSLGHQLELIWVGIRDRIPASLADRSCYWAELFQSTPIRSSSFQHPRDNQCIDWDLAALIYTSGSTGEPKGVMCPHFNMIAVAKSIMEYLQNSEEDIILSTLPISFGYGLYQVLVAFMLGSSVVLEKSFAFPSKVLEKIAKEQVSGFPIVPTIAAMLLKMRSLTEFDFASLRYMTNAAAALPVEHILKLRNLLPHVEIYSMYGLTECQRVTYLKPEEIDRRPSSVGKAIPNCEAFVVNEQGHRVAPGIVGELVIRGANVMRGYWNDRELSARTFRNGERAGETLLYSGDLFREDEEGFLYFVCRKDDLIKTKGERVSPKEVENALCGKEGVLEAAVIGVPDEILGQAIKAFVVPLPGVTITSRNVLKYCSTTLEAFMVPKYVEVVEQLPRTANGKLDKKLLT